jgi:hypothetical protein
MSPQKTDFGMTELNARRAHDISDYIDLLWSKSRQWKAEEDQQDNREAGSAQEAPARNS